MNVCCSVAYCIVLSNYYIFLSVQHIMKEGVLQCCKATLLYCTICNCYISLCSCSCSIMKMCCSVAYSYCIVLYTITIFCIILSVQLQHNENALQCCIYSYCIVLAIYNYYILYIFLCIVAA